MKSPIPNPQSQQTSKSQSPTTPSFRVSRLLVHSKRFFHFALLVLCPILTGFDDDDLSTATQKVLTQLRDRVGPSVVSILVERDKDPAAANVPAHTRTLSDYYKRPRGPMSGTVMDKDGHIMTSAFNMLGELKSITVITHGGKSYPAKLLGYHHPLDMALLKIEAKDLPALEWGKTEGLKQGDFVAHLGRSPDPGSATISMGIVSATGRHRGTALQVDAEMNYGSVGGPLVDLDGRLLGVTSHIDNRSHWGQSSGIGFATKAEEILKVLPQLKKGERIEKEKEPYIGISYADGEEIDGVRITQVVPNSPADEAGLEEGDIIEEFDGVRIKTADDLRNTLMKKKVGAEVTFKIKRSKGEDKFEEKTIKLKLGEKP